MMKNQLLLLGLLTVASLGLASLPAYAGSDRHAGTTSLNSTNNQELKSMNDRIYDQPPPDDRDGVPGRRVGGGTR